MHLQQIALVSRPTEIVCSSIRPDVGSVTTMFAELNVIPVRPTSGLEDKYQLMLTSVEGTHAGIVLYPDTNILQLGINFISGFEHLACMTRIHAYGIHLHPAD